MTPRTGNRAVRGALCVFVAGLLYQGTRAQAPADAPYSGTKLTRQQILDRLSSAEPGRTASAAGREIYAKVCANCHVFGETGTTIGPDLTTVASRFRTRDLLEAILWPSRTISEQYAITLFDLDDGSTVSGLVVREDRTNVYVRNADFMERPLPVPLARIRNRTTPDVSLMPEFLMEPFTLDEIQSLVTYMFTRPAP
jgi:putative heme-binding domain-containing protein